MRKKEVIQKTINVSNILPCKGQRLRELYSGRECYSHLKHNTVITSKHYSTIKSNYKLINIELKFM